MFSRIAHKLIISIQQGLYNYLFLLSFLKVLVFVLQLKFVQIGNCMILSLIDCRNKTRVNLFYDIYKYTVIMVYSAIANTSKMPIIELLLP